MLGQLSMMRGKESRYLKPLIFKVEGLLDYGIPQSLTLPHQPSYVDNGAVATANNVYAGDVQYRLQ